MEDCSGYSSCASSRHPMPKSWPLSWHLLPHRTRWLVAHCFPDVSSHILPLDNWDDLYESSLRTVIHMKNPRTVRTGSGAGNGRSEWYVMVMISNNFRPLEVLFIDPHGPGRAMGHVISGPGKDARRKPGWALGKPPGFQRWGLRLHPWCGMVKGFTTAKA